MAVNVSPQVKGAAGRTPGIAQNRSLSPRSEQKHLNVISLTVYKGGENQQPRGDTSQSPRSRTQSPRSRSHCAPCTRAATATISRSRGGR